MAKLKDFIPVEIEERLSFEILLTEIASDFVNLPSEHIDAAIIKAQERICNHLSLDRSVLWQLIEDASGEMWLSHVHEVSDSYLPATPFDAGKTFPWILEQILLGNDVTIERVEDLPSEAHQDRQSLSQWGVKSSFIMPLAAEEKVVGALSFGKLSQETIWSKSVKQRLQLIAQIFANALSRKKAERVWHLSGGLKTLWPIFPPNLSICRSTASTPRSKTPNNASVNVWMWRCLHFGSGRMTTHRYLPSLIYTAHRMGLRFQGVSMLKRRSLGCSK